ncbi:MULTISPECIES: hypothetical protein [Sphingomonadaceae]|jgi:hypothetical protein|uniref:PepSY domain-containing protein n=2 Tax=Sphingobium TaxID=165695 RepID=A0A4Q1KE36_9SPHN|nr:MULTISPECIES: hypothetical protein [Sphingomonadaceae]EZP64578.1 hypothetical protein BV96_04740 [Sphingomonas paucimobilis]RXR25986.1 hypothetical protein EQG66_13460 [Sphingobium fluviale]BAV66677.1 hypothetical protein SCLO_3000100 [Sphingobium cloacae]
MKRSLLAVALGAAGVGGIVVASTALAEPVPAAAKNQPFFANAHWDDDFDERRRFGPMRVPNVDAVKRAGIVDVVEIERDDGRLEVEGFDAQGREITLHMDRRGQRVLSVRRDRDWDD